MRQFEWSPDKADRNLAKHEIDFYDAIRVFEDTYVTLKSRHAGEERHVSIGVVQGRAVAVIWTPRGPGGEVTRIISARRARRNERKTYDQGLGGQS